MCVTGNECSDDHEDLGSPDFDNDLHTTVSDAASNDWDWYEGWRLHCPTVNQFFDTPCTTDAEC